MKSSAYYRSRLSAMYTLIDTLKGHPVYDHNSRSAKLTDRELLKVSYVNPVLKDLLEDGIKLADHPDNSPLTFLELTTLNTWFEMHPEKVCGEEQVTTSIHFPIQLKASRQEVERQIRQSLPPNKPSVQLAKAKMKMKLAVALALK